ncbi:tetratricopeptide repeat protein [Streptosporangium lutulentum]|uniref:tetratricopeptide repeat protein n=1 Tax=Streptosporangium lutulentum TaxID=1461250 RepID=UPI0027D87A7F|nr:tetratricopeptide repeat protein [Streptosporangium lutulentum]
MAAGDAQALTLQLLGLARELGATAGEVEEAIEGRRNPASLLWRSLEASDGWLLVIDNADDPRVLQVGDQPVAGGNGWLRPTTSGLLLVTSRVSGSPEWGRHVTVHRLNALSVEDGARMLLDLAPEAGGTAEARALSARLGGLALALRHAGMHLAMTFAAEREFAVYREALDGRGHQLMNESTEARSNIATTWELSLDLLESQGFPHARALLGVFSCFAAPSPIPAFLFDHEQLSAVCGDRGISGVIGGLTALHSVGMVEGTVTPDNALNGVIVHPLVAETTRHKLSGETLGRETATVAVRLVSGAAGGLGVDRSTDWPRWKQLPEHLRRFWMVISEDLDETGMRSLAEASAICAVGLTYGGAYHVALDLMEVALAGTENRLPADDPVVLELRHRHASAYMFLGLTVDAEREFRQLLEDRTRVLGPDHPKTLTMRHNLARVLADQGRLAEAQHEFSETYESKVRVLGPDDPDTLATRYEAARVLLVQGKASEAEQEHRSIYEVKVRVLGPEHPDTLVSRHEIPKTLLAQGRAVEAERELRELYDLRVRLLGPDHPHVMTTGHEMARAFAEQGRHEEAERQYRTVLEARRRVLGAENKYTLVTEEALSTLLRRPAGPTSENERDASGPPRFDDRK